MHTERAEARHVRDEGDEIDFEPARAMEAQGCVVVVMTPSDVAGALDVTEDEARDLISANRKWTSEYLVEQAFEAIHGWPERWE